MGFCENIFSVDSRELKWALQQIKKSREAWVFVKSNKLKHGCYIAPLLSIRDPLQ